VIELLLVDDDDELACQAFDDGVTATQRENVSCYQFFVVCWQQQ